VVFGSHGLYSRPQAERKVPFSGEKLLSCDMLKCCGMVKDRPRRNRKRIPQINNFDAIIVSERNKLNGLFNKNILEMFVGVKAEYLYS